MVGLLYFGDDDMIKLVPYLFALKNNKILTQVIYVLLQYFPNWTFFSATTSNYDKACHFDVCEKFVNML